MSLSKVYCRANDGMRAPLVNVEVHVGNGLPSLTIVGLPATAVKESRDRVRAAIVNAGFQFPMRKITVNLAPADIPKDGGRFDLSIALGILSASSQLPETALHDKEFIAELSLGGELRSVSGILPSAFAAKKANRGLVVAKENADEAALIDHLPIASITHLKSLCNDLIKGQLKLTHSIKLKLGKVNYALDMVDVKGQYQAKRVIEIAASGGHNLLMVGPPGTGKTMLAKRLPSILPLMTNKEALESASVMSVSRQGFDISQWGIRSIREPHHSASSVALVGGGSKVAPGEISLAHHGVLFLDELTEFKRTTLDGLREPLEHGEITLSRATRSCTYPANFQLIAAMNPCPQGYDCDMQNNCQCTLEQRKRYRSRISAPFLDRIDIQVEVPRITYSDLQTKEKGESSQVIRQRVIATRRLQIQRQECLNSRLSVTQLEAYCELSEKQQQIMALAMDRLHLSARAYHKILKVARTIADMDSLSKQSNRMIATQHLTEALSYRTIMIS